MIARFASRLSAAALGLALAAAPAVAHHGWADYGEEEFQVSGVVESASLGGPHGRMSVRAPDGLWEVVLAPPPAIQRSGLVAANVPRGTRVTARGHRHKQRLEIKTERLVVGQRTFDLYPNRP